MIDFGKYQNELSKLGSLSPNRYENIFKMYQNGDLMYFYNIINSVVAPEEIDKSFYYTVTVNRKVPWTTISYEQYATMDLWWMICLFNNIKNPIKYADPGQELKILKPEYLPLITQTIKQLISL